MYCLCLHRRFLVRFQAETCRSLRYYLLFSFSFFLSFFLSFFRHHRRHQRTKRVYICVVCSQKILVARRPAGFFSRYASADSFVGRLLVVSLKDRVGPPLASGRSSRRSGGGSNSSQAAPFDPGPPRPSAQYWAKNTQ